ncbi:hypothetical protein K402DRAFT_396559 [Aulographum hederae CBS 113979]|uniref:Uncharacterized protein n=1 Tax=Aulographum hederae CBS 113979 TaxID=1176131 RepID=A0A6G1GRI8_9PEZI|nr:hypothetical protein K402DRAFT_396559 [Aulographum hederae CBS 113979]
MGIYSTQPSKRVCREEAVKQWRFERVSTDPVWPGNEASHKGVESAHGVHARLHLHHVPVLQRPTAPCCCCQFRRLADMWRWAVVRQSGRFRMPSQPSSESEGETLLLFCWTPGAEEKSDEKENGRMYRLDAT